MSMKVSPHSGGIVNKTILFEATDNEGAQGLWVTDGTSELVQGDVDVDGLSPPYLVSYNIEVVFDCQSASDPSSLWVSDGTAAGASALNVPGANTEIGLAPKQLTVPGGRVYFAGVDASNTIGLWVTKPPMAARSRSRCLPAIPPILRRSPRRSTSSSSGLACGASVGSATAAC